MLTWLRRPGFGVPEAKGVGVYVIELQDLALLRGEYPLHRLLFGGV